jgi:protein-disulfide isomerase
LKSYYIGLSDKPADPATIKAVVKKIGLNENIVDKAKKDEKVRNVIEANYSAAKELNLQGTPALIVNGKFIGGMVSANELKVMLNSKK